jgi:hypothetical protein
MRAHTKRELRRWRAIDYFLRRDWFPIWFTRQPEALKETFQSHVKSGDLDAMRTLVRDSDCLEIMTYGELLWLAREYRIHNYSRLNRTELMEAIHAKRRANQTNPEQDSDAGYNLPDGGSGAKTS